MNEGEHTVNGRRKYGEWSGEYYERKKKKIVRTRENVLETEAKIL